jgi:hypothetical protein
MDETPGWVAPTPPADGDEPASAAPPPSVPPPLAAPPSALSPLAAPPSALSPLAAPPSALPPPAAPAPTLPAASQYFTSPKPPTDGSRPPAASSWESQPASPPMPNHRYGDYGPPSPGQPQAAPPQYGPPGQVGPPAHYVPDPRFGVPTEYGAAGQYSAPQQPGQYPQYPQYPGNPQFGGPQYGNPQFGGPQYGGPQYGGPQYGGPQYGGPQYGPQYGQWGGYQQEYKPGIVPLRPLSVGEVLDGSFSTIRKNPRIVFGFAAVLSVIAQLIRLLIGLALNNVPGAFGSSSFSSSSFGSGDNGTSTTTNTNTLHSVSTSLGSSAATLVVNALCVAVLAGVVTGVVGKAVIGQRADGREVIAAVRQRWFGLLIVSILAEILPWAPVVVVVLIAVLLAAVSTGLGIAVGVIGGLGALALGVLFWGRLAVAVPIFILERRGPGASIARSWRLVKGAFWRTWGLRALVQIIISIAASILSIPLVLVLLPSVVHGKTPSTIVLVLLVIFGAVVWMLTQPLVAASLTLIYIDRRMRAEGLDVQLTQAARAASAHTASVT